MDLKVFEDNEAEANAELQARENAGKSARIEKFEDWQAVLVEKANGAQHDDPEFWEAIFYYNGSFKLMQRFSWHKDPDPEGYYADFVLKM